MAYLVGVALALGVGLFTTVAGFDRDRSLYPVVLVVIASYYALFAIMGGGVALGWETGVFTVFALASTIGFRINLWIVAVALVGHGLLDWHHGHLIENSGVPAWWPMFCLSYDVTAGAYLAWRILSGNIEAAKTSSYGSRVDCYVSAELAAARAAELGGDPSNGFHRLERAHVLGQQSTVQHVRVHLHMFMWGMRHYDLREVVGQIQRIIGAAAGTWAGLVPTGNTGGTNVSAFKSMAIPEDLADHIAKAHSSAANVYGVAER